MNYLTTYLNNDIYFTLTITITLSLGSTRNRYIVLKILLLYFIKLQQRNINRLKILIYVINNILKLVNHRKKNRK